jgi:hypothetical protein
LRALAFAVVLGMADAIFQPLADLVFKDPLSNGSAGEVLFYMNILYHVIFYLLKRGR